ncbi:MAG: AAA family ATPase [Desulfurococcales archaeon]|nr:AAA family ATPase [Desulfurococcales archaeon]
MDKLLGGGITERSLVLIAGNPGMGKTTLAGAIAFSACSMGLKSLYVSLVEDEEAFLEHMDSIGLDLRGCRDKGLFHFMDAVYVASWETLTDLLANMYEKVVVDGFRLIVIDSITAFLQVVDDKPRIREILRNFFARALGKSGATVIALSELPIGAEVIGSGVEEFLADALIYLRAEMVHNRMDRRMEIRKVKWAPLVRVKVPYRITPGKPIEVYAPESMPEAYLESVSFRRLFSGVEHLGKKNGGLVELLDASGKPITPSEVEAIGRAANLPHGIPIVHYYKSPTGIAAILVTLTLLWEPGENVTVLSTKLPRYYSGTLLKELLGVREGNLSVYNINPAFYTLAEFTGLTHDVIERDKPNLFILEGMDLLRLMGPCDEVIDDILNLTTWLRMRRVSPVYIYYREPEQEILSHVGVVVEADPEEMFVVEKNGRIWQHVNVKLRSSFSNISVILRYDVGLLSKLMRKAFMNNAGKRGE